MAVNTANVKVGQAVLYTAPVGTTPPLQTLAPGAPWLPPWVHVGATEEGVSFAVGTDTGDIRIEEQATPVMVVMNSRNIRVIVALAEDTVENMLLAYGGGTITTQAAASGIPGKKRLVLADELVPFAAGFESTSAASTPSLVLFRRVVIPRVISVADVTTAYRRSTNNRAYAIELRAICAASEVVIDDQTAVALP